MKLEQDGPVAMISNARRRALSGCIVFLICMPSLSLGQTQGAEPLRPPSGSNLKLLRVERKSAEPAQAWVEMGSLVRRGTNAEAWMLQILGSDRPSPRGPITGMWTKLQVDCQNLSASPTHQAEVQTTGQVSPTVASQARTPAPARAGTVGARVVDVFCTAQTPNAFFANSLTQAIQVTRNPSLANSNSGSVGQPVTSARPPGPRFVTLRECSFRYSALAQAANMKKRNSGLSDGDRALLEAAEKEYDLRAKDLLPNEHLGADSVNEVLVRIAPFVRAPRAEVQVELNKLKALAAQCDSQLGNQALPVP